MRGRLLSRAHPLRPLDEPPATAPGAHAQTLAHRASGRTYGWPADAASVAAAPRRTRTAPSPTRIRRKAPPPLRTPDNDRIDHPRTRRSLRRGWTRLPFHGSLLHGERVRCAHREGSGLIHPGLHLLRPPPSTSASTSMAMTTAHDREHATSSDLSVRRPASTTGGFCGGLQYTGAQPPLRWKEKC